MKRAPPSQQNFERGNDVRRKSEETIGYNERVRAIPSNVQQTTQEQPLEWPLSSTPLFVPLLFLRW